MKKKESAEGAHEELVTGYAEYRASLSGRKRYRKAEESGVTHNAGAVRVTPFAEPATTLRAPTVQE